MRLPRRKFYVECEEKNDGNLKAGITENVNISINPDNQMAYYVEEEQ